MTTLDEFMAVKANAYMAVVDSWRPRTAALKANYDDYKRWATTPDGTYWSGQFAGAAQVAAADDCKGTDNADDTVEDVAKLAAATIEYEVLPPLTGGQNLIERVLQNKDRVSIDQDFKCDYHPAEGESEESIARNREHVAESERLIKEYVAKWEKGCQTLKTQTDAARETMLSRINPKAAVVDGRKILRDAAAPADPSATSVNYKEMYPKTEAPASTQAAAVTAADPNAPVLGPPSPKPAIDPRAGSLTDNLVRMDPSVLGRQTHVEKTPGQALDPNSPAGKAAINSLRGMYQSQGMPPAQVEAKIQEALKAGGQDQYAVKFADPNAPSASPSEHVSRDFGEQWNKFFANASDGGAAAGDALLQQGKELTGQAGPGAPGVAEAWKDLGANTAKGLWDYTTATPQERLEMLGNEAHRAADNPGGYLGEKLVQGAAGAATAPIGGEAVAGARALLGDLTHHLPEPHTPVAGHATTEAPSSAAHPTPTVDHPAPTVDHPTPTGGDSIDAGGAPHPADVFDPSRGQHYASGDPHYPGGWPPHTPEPTWTKGDPNPGWEHINRGPEKPWMDYQSQITGIERTPEGRIPEWVATNPETGEVVRFDSGPIERGDQQVILDAKHNYTPLFESPGKPWTQNIEGGLVKEAERQLGALPPGTNLEWHVANPQSAAIIRNLLEDKQIFDVNVIYTPEKP